MPSKRSILVAVLLLLSAIGVLLIPQEISAAASIETPSNVPSEAQVNQTFSFNTTLNNVQSGEIYFVKCRLGSSSSSLIEGQTYNSASDSWLSDTSAWVDMPTVSVSGTTASFSIQCRAKSTATTGQKVVYARACLKKSDGTCGTSFQSSSGVTMTVTDTTSPSPSPSPSTSSTSAFTISNVPSQIDSTQTFTTSVNLELSSYPSTKFYLKGAFIKSAGTNYFGLTKVNNSWIKNSSSSSSQYEITTDSAGKWSGSLEVQPDVMDSGYEGTNDYIFKVARYTSSGSGPTWSNESNIKINAKEVEMAEESINLAGLSPPKPSAVLGESKKQENLPEIVYSLEKYKKSSTPAARKTSSPSAKVKIASQKIPLYFYIIGGVLIFAAGAATVYIHEKIRN